MGRWKCGLPSPWWIAFVLAVFGRNVCAQDQNFYYAAPQARYLPSNYQQHDYINQPNHQTFQQTSTGFQPLESYFPTHRDLQTSDLPVHLQQTLPQYRFSSTKLPKGSFHHFPGTGAHPAPFRPQPDIRSSALMVTPSTHRHLFNKNHDDTETFLGQITIESPAELPPEFNKKPSLEFPNKVAKRPVNQNLDESMRNTVSLGFLNHRTRIFAPTSSNHQDFKNKPQVKDYFVSVNGDVYASGRSTTPYPITTLVRKDRYNPLLYKPTTETTDNFEIRRRQITTPHTFDLESLLEEPIDESLKRDKQSDHVEVIKSVTVSPDEFYTFASSAANDSTKNDEEEDDEYETTDEDVTGTLELHENDNNVSDILDNSLIKSKDDKGYDVVTMKPSTMVKDDNFKQFVDSTVIDNTSSDVPNTTIQQNEDGNSSETNQPIDRNVTVVTTNSTIIGAVTPTPKPILNNDESSESWIVVASVQTSRSVSGARYLPSPIVEQEERTRLLLNEPPQEDTTEESSTTSRAAAMDKTRTSTESLIDKLDRVQSDLLSIGLLSDGFKASGHNNIAVLQENNSMAETTVLDMDMTTASYVTTVRAIGPAVVIKKFMPNARPTFKPTFQTRPKPAADLQDIPQADEPIQVNNDTLRKPVLPSDIRKYLPIGYTRPPNLLETQPKTIADILLFNDGSTTAKLKQTDDLLDDVTTVGPNTTTTVVVAKKDDISAFLPPGYYKLMQKETTIDVAQVHNKTDSTQQPDLFKDTFLPTGGGYKKPTPVFVNSTKQSPSTNKTKLVIAQPVDVDISKFLPPGYKPRSITTRKPPTKEEVPTTEVTITSTKATVKVVFPSRRGGGVRKPAIARLTTPKYSQEADGGSDKNVPSITAPTIHKGWPSRATTEFTGWPTPSTTPISIERLLEKARLSAAAAAAAAAVSSTDDTPSTFTTTTTTFSSPSTTSTTQQPTTPGLCRGECDLAGTIKLVGGAKWVPELLDRNTKEWQILANEVQSQLEDVYSKSSVLNKWYKRIRIDGFSEGSVLVDYLVELNELGTQVDTVTIKRLFHDSLVEARPVSNREPKASDLVIDEDFNDEENDTIIRQGGISMMVEGPRFGLGNFIVDPTFTDFIVIPKQLQPTIGYADENVLLPQWAIAVIVIGLASLLFVIIFGVTVLVNRQKSAKKKQPTPLTEDMLHELNKNHMSGIDNYGADDDLYNMEDVWNDRNPYDTKIPNKKRSTGSIHGDNSMANLYDSWKSEWNGYYYNAHYGNAHQQPGGSSTHSGPAYGHHQYNGRRRSDYDTNF